MNKFTLLTAGALASVFVSGSVLADEVSSSNTDGVVSVASETGNTSATSVETSVQGAATTESSGPVATTVTKSGDEINIQNPEVSLDRSEGQGKYNGFQVGVSATIPDDVPVNEGDKVVLSLPEEVKFQTSFNFDVRNSTNDVVGNAVADASTGKLTTTFNNYFKNNPLNKQMSWQFDAKWTDKVESGKPVSANFNGTVLTVNIAEEQSIGTDELVAKWGSQDADDPTVINWTVRVNYARRVLDTVKLLDSMSNNQTLVDDYLKVEYVDKAEPYVSAGDAKALVKSMIKNRNGFELTLNRLDRMVYVYYKTKLKNAVKDSTNPKNSIELVAGDTTTKSTFGVSLVGGRGDAVGENKQEPEWELPNEAPKYEKPSINLDDVPLMPPPLVYEKPEINLEDVSLLPPAPVVELPEVNLEDIPPMPPSLVYEKPEIAVEDVPILPPAPIHDLPEYVFPEEPTKVEVPKDTEKVKELSYGKTQGVSERTYSAPAVLPATGEGSSLVLTMVGVALIGASYAFVRKVN